MSTKTEFDYNEDNFIEKDKEMHELTVTITLGEYRNLIEERVYSEKAIEKLQEENETLRKANQNLSHLVISKNPEIVKEVFAKMKDIIFGDTVEETKEDDTDNE